MRTPKQCLTNEINSMKILKNISSRFDISRLTKSPYFIRMIFTVYFLTVCMLSIHFFLFVLDLGGLTLEYLRENVLFYLLYYVAPIGIAVLVFSLVDKIKSYRIFYVFSGGLLILSIFINFNIEWILFNPRDADILAILAIVTILIVSFSLTKYWTLIFINKKYELIKLSYLPLLTCILWIIVEAYSSYSGKPTPILLIYETVGTFIFKYTTINIFYLDYYGFIPVFLSLTATIVLHISWWIHNKYVK